MAITTLAELKSQLLAQSTKVKLILLATPIFIGSGIYLYYYYSTKSPKDGTKSKDVAPITNPLKLALMKAVELKNKGNECFRKKDYDKALEMYTEAISVCPPDRKKEISTFYQNRAACYEHMKQYDEVIKDSTKAIENDKVYIKAYLRRGKANEILGNHGDASFDYYVASNASHFQNSDYMKLLSESLEKYAQEKATKIVEKRKNHTFQKYMFKHLLNKYSCDPLKKRMTEILNEYDQKIEKLLNDTNDENLDHDDLLFKGTIELYLGKHKEGKEKLTRLIETGSIEYKVNAHLKLAEYALQNNKFEEAEEHIKQAMTIDSNNADVHYVNSQLQILSRKYDEAVADLKKAIELDPNFVSAIGQKLYIRFQQNIITNNFIGKNQILKEFEENDKKFPHSNELKLLYFQILMSDGETKKAEDVIMKAIENDPEDPTLYVYRALIFIENGQIEKTKEFLDQALEMDPRCSFAYEMLADLCTKLENFPEALDYLEKAIINSTTFDDAKNLLLKQKALSMQVKSQSLF